jgi:hypothetical protein
MTYGIIALALVSSALLTACEGARKNAGEKADAAMNASGGLFGDGPQERPGEIQDPTARNQAKATEAAAGAAGDRADEFNAVADQRADALKAQAKDIRHQTKMQAGALHQQADPFAASDAATLRCAIEFQERRA